MKATIRFDINQYVRVRLTPRGKALHRHLHNQFNAINRANISYVAPVEDEGWSTWTMAELMKCFGPFIEAGFDAPIRPTIEVLADINEGTQ